MYRTDHKYTLTYAMNSLEAANGDSEGEKMNRIFKKKIVPAESPGSAPIPFFQIFISDLSTNDGFLSQKKIFYVHNL